MMGWLEKPSMVWKEVLRSRRTNSEPSPSNFWMVRPSQKRKLLKLCNRLLFAYRTYALRVHLRARTTIDYREKNTSVACGCRPCLTSRMKAANAGFKTSEVTPALFSRRNSFSFLSHICRSDRRRGMMRVSSPHRTIG